jgi:hypothetical protein
MAEELLKQQLALLQTEMAKLKVQLQNSTPPRSTASKNMSVVSLIPKWSSPVKSTPVQEFLDTVEGAARVGNWSYADMVQVAAQKLVDTAKTFYSGCKDLHDLNITWAQFRNIFQERFRDTHTEQYHFLQLQTATQNRGESPQEFAGRCRALCLSTLVAQ